MRRLSLAFNFMLWLCIATAQGQEPNMSVGEKAFNALFDLDSMQGPRDERAHAKLLADKYTELLGNLDARTAKSLTDDDLIYRMRALFMTAFYDRDDGYIAQMRAGINELERRSKATDDIRARYYENLVGYRKFEEARKYLFSHPSLEAEPVPQVEKLPISSKVGILVYRIPPNQPKLIEKRLNLQNGLHLVAIVHPQCGPSRRAMGFIESSDSISEAVRGNVIWLSPAAMPLTFEAFQDWNRKHPSIQIMLTDKQRDVPLIASWATPTFYLIDSGKVIDQFSGWPPDNVNSARLLKMLRRAGLQE